MSDFRIVPAAVAESDDSGDLLAWGILLVVVLVVVGGIAAIGLTVHREFSDRLRSSATEISSLERRVADQTAQISALTLKLNATVSAQDSLSLSIADTSRRVEQIERRHGYGTKKKPHRIIKPGT